jgi:rhomboid protease GluP
VQDPTPVPEPGLALIPLRPPTATRALLVGVAVYWVMLLIAGGPGDIAALVAFGANFGPLVGAGEIWRLVASMFLHASWLHVALNGYALYLLGRNVEAFYGPWKLLAIFLGSGLVGGLASAILSDGLSVGASGGIFGLLGASLVFAFRYRGVLPPRVTMIMGTMLLPWVALNLVLGFLVPRIDMNAHLGGMAGGALLALLLAPDALTEARTGMRPAPPRQLASVCLSLLIVSFGAAGVNIFRMRGEGGPVLDPRVVAYLDEADRRAAMEVLEKQLQGNPDDPELLLLRGQVHTMAEQWEAAIADYRAVLAITPDDAGALNNLAWILLEEAPPELRDRPEAERLARRAVELAPEDPYALGTYGTARLRAGDADGAARLLERALETSRPGREESTDRYLLAMALAELGRPEEAEEQLRHAMRQDARNDYRDEAESAVRRIQSAPSP